MREQDGSEEENAGDRDRERNLEREGTISRERRGVKEKNQPHCREERETEMRERESEGNHRKDCKKNPHYHFLILQLHCYGKTPGKKKIVNPKRENNTEEGGRRNNKRRGRRRRRDIQGRKIIKERAPRVSSFLGSQFFALDNPLCSFNTSIFGRS